MGVSLIEKLFATADTISGKAYRLLGAVDDVTGKARPLKGRPNGSLSVSQDPDSLDAFGRARVSEPRSVFDVKQVFNKAPLFFDEDLTGSITPTSTHLPNEAATRLRILSGTTTGAKAIRQSFVYAPYQPGRSQLVFLTGLFGAAVANADKRIGLFDDQNGLFFELAGDGTFSIGRRTFTSGSAVDTKVAKAAWNLDVLDGTGPSGVTLDLTKMQLMVIDYAWLGLGRIRFGFRIGDKTIWVHAMDTANTASLVYMTNPSLPVRYEVRTTGTIGSNADLYHVCSAVFSEGGYDTSGVIIAQSTSTVKTCGTTATPLLSIRLASAYNRALVEPKSFRANATTADTIIVEVWLGGTLTGAAFAAISGSICELDTTATVVSGGVCIASDILNATTSRASSEIIDSALRLASRISGTAQILTVTGRTLSATGSVIGSLTWKEIY